MTCRELNAFLLEYLEGTLESSVQTEFDEHLEDCPPCVGYLRSYAATIRMSQESFRDPEAPVPADVPEKLVRAILAARPTPKRS